ARLTALAIVLGLLQGAVFGQSMGLADAVQRVQQLLLQRQDSGCVLCHRIPGLPVGGDIGPSLHGLADRANVQAVRERLVDPRRFNPMTIMPAYFSLDGLTNVARAYQGKTILNEQALDDILAYLMKPEGSRQ
ncbi:MAG: sulfur oxidation c-type cytochrome SoxX, partial [Burkholderiales bacterium]|nr:sulfur oxidation c-type cytochrome SoxX [Burkholderiales bacterium]